MRGAGVLKCPSFQSQGRCSISQMERQRGKVTNLMSLPAGGRAGFRACDCHLESQFFSGFLSSEPSLASQSLSCGLDRAPPCVN